MARFGDDTGNLLEWAPWASIGVKLGWAIMVLGHVAVFGSFLGHPPTVLMAFERVELSQTAEAKDPITGRLADTRAFNILEITAAVVISPDAIWVYDLGPDIGVVGSDDYPGEMFFLNLADGKLRPEDRVGQYIAALGEHLEARRRNLDILLGDDAPHRVQLAIDRRVPFETTRAVLYTAGQERYSDFSFLLQDGDSVRVQDDIMPTIRAPTMCAKGGPVSDLLETVAKLDLDGLLEDEKQALEGAK
jgi:hypothetical protein